MTRFKSEDCSQLCDIKLKADITSLKNEGDWKRDITPKHERLDDSSDRSHRLYTERAFSDKNDYSETKLYSSYCSTPRTLITRPDIETRLHLDDSRLQSNYREKSERLTDVKSYSTFREDLDGFESPSSYLSAGRHNIRATSLDTCKDLTDDRRSRSCLSEARPKIMHRPRVLESPMGNRRKPVFSTHLTDRTAVEGSRVKLTCSVFGTPEPNVSWLRQGANLEDKMRFRTKYANGLITLEVLNAIPSDSAEYTCVAENEYGKVSTAANLRVHPTFEATPIPPTFTRSIRDAYHIAENELVLECRIRGQPLPKITWLKDDRVIELKDRYESHYLADGVCRLIINKPLAKDSGQYTCKAENPLWSDQISHVVHFAGPDQYLSRRTPTPSRLSRNLNLSRRPHFSNVLTDLVVPAGGTIGFNVEVKGGPSDVVWLRSGERLPVRSSNLRTFVEHGLYSLYLSDATESESGLYTCRAENSYGNVDMTAHVQVVTASSTISGKPAILVSRPDKDISVLLGEDFSISFRAQGEPKPKITWSKGVRDITNSQRTLKETSDDYVRFTLKRTVITDGGTYCVLAKNCYGCDRAFVTVAIRQRSTSETLISDWTHSEPTFNYHEVSHIKDAPGPISTEPIALEGGRNWLSLSWGKPTRRGAAPVLAYKVEAWQLGGDGGARWAELGITPINSFDAFNLRPGHDYLFRVSPRNRHGWGEAVQTHCPISVGHVVEMPEFRVILPGQIKCLKGTSASLSCMAFGDPTPHITWFRDGLELEPRERFTTRFNGTECLLHISDIRVEDEGRYMCEAKNPQGRVSTFARVLVVTDPKIFEAHNKLKRRREDEMAASECAPQFTMRLRDRRVQVTYPVRLTCQITGIPIPDVVWLKDGDDLLEDSRHEFSKDDRFHTLEISKTTLEDSGVYSASASNALGSVSCHCNLVVDKGIRAYISPDFCCGLEPKYTIQDGGELRISAYVEAYPSVGITWHRNGIRLRPSRRIITTLDHDGFVELTVANVTRRDEGVYTCTATNQVGQSVTSTKIVVECSADDEPTSDSDRLSIPTLISPDRPYSKEPLFLKKPQNVTAYEGDTVIISCEVIGDPKPEVTWLRDFLKPEYYRDAAQFKRVGDGEEYSLEIPHTKLNHTGTYSVIAKNCHGEVKSIISLQIYVKGIEIKGQAKPAGHPEIVKGLSDVQCCDGDSAMLECVVRGDPTPDLVWFKNNEVYELGKDIVSQVVRCPNMSLKCNLIFPKAYEEDEAQYACVVSNSLGHVITSCCLLVNVPEEKENNVSNQLIRPPTFGSATSTPRSTPRQTPMRSITPEIGHPASKSNNVRPPKFTIMPSNQIAYEGDTVKFVCAIDGHPAPWVKWDKNCEAVMPSSRIILGEDKDVRYLEIKRVTQEDAGVYRLTVENDVGRVEATARLEIMCSDSYPSADLYIGEPSQADSEEYNSEKKTSNSDETDNKMKEKPKKKITKTKKAYNVFDSTDFREAELERTKQISYDFAIFNKCNNFDQLEPGVLRRKSSTLHDNYFAPFVNKSIIRNNNSQRRVLVTPPLDDISQHERICLLPEKRIKIISAQA